MFGEFFLACLLVEEQLHIIGILFVGVVGFLYAKFLIAKHIMVQSDGSSVTYTHMQRAVVSLINSLPLVLSSPHKFSCQAKLAVLSQNTDRRDVAVRYKVLFIVPLFLFHLCKHVSDYLAT